MSCEIIYPIMVKMKSKDVNIGSIKIRFENARIVSSSQEEWDAIVQEYNIQFKKGDFITKVRSGWR